MILTAANTYSGSTTISQGTLQLGNGGTTGSILAASTITLGDGNTRHNPVAFLVNRSDVNTHANNIVVSASGSGTATIGSTGTAGGGFGTIFSGTVTLNRPTTMQGTDPDRTTFTNVISGNVGTLTVTGGARTTWEANNTFVGNVVVTGSGTVLQVGEAGNQIPDASNVDLGAGTSLWLNNDGEAINALTGSGTVQNIVGANTLTMGANDGGGTFTGTLNNGSGALSLTKTGGGTQTIAGSGGTNNNASGLLTVSGGQLDVGAGFAGDGAWKGNVAISGGTLRLMQSNVFANGSDWTINSPGQFNMNGQGDAIGNITGNGSITNNGGLPWTTCRANATFSGNISGTAADLSLRGVRSRAGTPNASTGRQ